MFFFSQGFRIYVHTATRTSSGAKHKGMDFVCLGRNGWMDEDGKKRKKKNESIILQCVGT